MDPRLVWQRESEALMAKLRPIMADYLAPVQVEPGLWLYWGKDACEQQENLRPESWYLYDGEEFELL